VDQVAGRSFQPKEIDFFQFLGEPYFIAYAPPSPSEREPWRNIVILLKRRRRGDQRDIRVASVEKARAPGSATTRGRSATFDG
jgi:hypothetical protein